MKGVWMCRAFEQMRQEGEQKGRQEGEQLYSQLILILFKEGKQDLLTRAAQNPDFLKQLYVQYNLV